MSDNYWHSLDTCPNYGWDRMQAVVEPARYTLGEATLLRMLGYDAGVWLDWDNPDAAMYEMAEIRKPKVTRTWAERNYSQYACTQAEWLLAEAWG